MRSIPKRAVLGLSLVSFLAASGDAVQPFSTDDAGTVPAATFELEAGSDFWKDNAAAFLGLKHGVTDRMDIGVSVGYVPLPEDDRSFEGATLGLKFGLVPDLLAASLSASFGETLYQLNGILSKELGSIAVHVNLGCEAVAALDEATLTYGLSAGWARKRINVGAEVNGNHKGECWCQAGGGVAITGRCKLCAGVGAELEDTIEPSARACIWFAFPSVPDEK